MKNILVTGGAGYIGSHMVLALINEGYNPIIIDNFANSTNQNLETISKITGKALKVIKHNLQDEMENINLPEISAVVHFAALKAVGESVLKPLEYYRNNTLGTLNLINFCNKCNIKNIIFSSTAAVYGNPKEPVVSETTPLNAESPYAWSKIFSEQLIKDSAKVFGLNAIILRYFNVAGNISDGSIGDTQLNCQNLIPSVILSHLGIRKTKLQVFGRDYPTLDGTGVRDYIHVEDLIDAHIKSLKYLETNSGVSIFNLGTGNGFSVLEILKTFEKVTGEKLDYTFAERREGDIATISTNSSLAKDVLGWKASRTLEEMISSSWKWYTTHFRQRV